MVTSGVCGVRGLARDDLLRQIDRLRVLVIDLERQVPPVVLDIDVGFLLADVVVLLEIRARRRRERAELDERSALHDAVHGDADRYLLAADFLRHGALPFRVVTELLETFAVYAAPLDDGAGGDLGLEDEREDVTDEPHPP
jgi:hypothetical protein